MYYFLLVSIIVINGMSVSVKVGECQKCMHKTPGNIFPLFGFLPFKVIIEFTCFASRFLEKNQPVILNVCQNKYCE